jgi:hypothetical protein
MQTKNNGKQPKEREEKRDLELENVVGNLLVAEYQVDRLRARLSDMIDRYRPRVRDNNKASTHVFKHNNKWYKLSLRLDEETDVNSDKENGAGKTDSQDILPRNDTY